MQFSQTHMRQKMGVYFCISLTLALTTAISSQLFADETCMSPYMAKIVGQEDFVYVWTLGKEGVGDEQDKLVTVDVNPALTQLRQSRQFAVCRGAQRSTPLGPHRRPPLPLGRRTGHQQDLHL